MGNHIAITKNGKHKIGRKLFITDENKKHRRVKKGFLTVGGVHKLVFAAGRNWVKYSCNFVPAHYAETGAGGHFESDWLDSEMFLYNTYDFSASKGYTGTAGGYYSAGEEAVGKYKVDEDRVIKITELTEKIGSILHYTGVVAATCERVEDAYSKGSTSYGSTFADEWELPEVGTLIAGSVAEGYCVLEIGGVKYYYELVE